MSEDKIAVKEPEINELERVHRELANWRGKAFLLTPYARTHFDCIRAGFRPEFRVTYISPDPADYQVYQLDRQPDKLVLTKIGLQLLDHLAGIKWTRVWNALDPKTDPLHDYYCKMGAEGKMQDLDGEFRNSINTATLDLRDGSVIAEKMIKSSPDGKQLIRARLNIKSQTETLAKNKVRRELLGLQPTFTRKELTEKPFVILKLNPVRDMNDPLVRKLTVMEQFGISSELYDQAVKEVIPVPQMEPITVDVPATSVPSPPVVFDRKKMIKSVEELYRKKVRGGRSLGKKPIAELTDQELVEMENLLVTREDVSQ